ncbi:hypothetical protein EYF80_035461 [Liparis tanakae]|uniref:Uncharacterized protein n=1 Tax=Liparis tanakae TaxID=230148 RepID=A0A4Z2GM64_9TELE|nr:hypothetical protein EYF80_035461 [Liparis tanakae]
MPCGSHSLPTASVHNPSLPAVGAARASLCEHIWYLGLLFDPGLGLVALQFQFIDQYDPRCWLNTCSSQYTSWFHPSYLVLSLSCWVLISFSLGCPQWTSCLATWFTTATRDAWLFISGSRLSNLPGDKTARSSRFPRSCVGDPHRCCTTSRSSSFSGMSMLLSHCSFSSIHTSQAQASVSIL